MEDSKPIDPLPDHIQEKIFHIFHEMEQLLKSINATAEAYKQYVSPFKHDLFIENV